MQPVYKRDKLPKQLRQLPERFRKLAKKTRPEKDKYLLEYVKLKQTKIPWNDNEKPEDIPARQVLIDQRKALLDKLKSLLNSTDKDLDNLLINNINEQRTNYNTRLSTYKRLLKPNFLEQLQKCS